MRKLIFILSLLLSLNVFSQVYPLDTVEYIWEYNPHTNRPDYTLKLVYIMDTMFYFIDTIQDGYGIVDFAYNGSTPATVTLDTGIIFPLIRNFISDTIIANDSIYLHAYRRDTATKSIYFEDTIFNPGLSPLPVGSAYGRFLMQEKGTKGIHWASLQNVKDTITANTDSLIDGWGIDDFWYNGSIKDTVTLDTTTLFSRVREIIHDSVTGGNYWTLDGNSLYPSGNDDTLGNLDFVLPKMYIDTIRSDPDFPDGLTSRGGWSTWSPSLVWSGATPTVLSSTYRYSRINNTIHFIINIRAENNTGLTATMVRLTLPVTPKDINAYWPANAGWSATGGLTDASTVSSAIDCRDNTASNRILYIFNLRFTTGNTYGFYVTGKYEID